jgi:Histidine kinase-, DNA gyrase B-, and HSP90-like ATPase
VIPGGAEVSRSGSDAAIPGSPKPLYAIARERISEPLMETIPVTIDKSHIITIGERLYAESIEFIRELVNNAYDADATLVEVKINDETVEVGDNGTGMDREGLRQYFNIGSPYKLEASRSPVHHRQRIGQFGIGKFATLAACKRFEVTTRKGAFAARIVFDKEDWQASGDTWHLPLELLAPEARKEEGTTVVLTGLLRRFEPRDIESKIIEGTPLKAPHFKVRLNGRPILPRSLSGHRIPVLDGTPFGPVTGEIVILPETAAKKEDLGIEVKVKQVTIKRELFGMEMWGKAMARVRGEVNADFLPITSDRSGFLKDAEEYKSFEHLMVRVMGEVKRALQSLSTRREKKVVSRALKETLQRVYRALALNPDFSPFGALPLAGSGDGIGGAAKQLAERKAKEAEEVKPEAGGPPKGRKERKKKPKVRELTPNAVIKKMRFGDYGVSCVVDSFGEDGPEVFSEETTIYINRDHPLYKRESKKFDTHILNLGRLFTQEIAMMKDPRNPRQAFERQSKLLRDAFTERS